MDKDKDEIRKEIREELEDAGLFVVNASMVQKNKYYDVLEDMRDNGEVKRGDDDGVNRDYSRPMCVYVSS